MIFVVYGTRPEALKLAPVVREAERRGLPVYVHCTMQSPDLVDREILPWHTMTEAHLLDRLQDARLVVVQGDTRTAFETAVAAYQENVPIFHVEAGLRTHNTASPWPEEGYRQMISRIARYHACISTNGLVNLIEERVGTARNLPTATIRVTGSPVVESVQQRVAELQTVSVASPKQILLTLHRRENRPHFKQILRGVAGYAHVVGARVVWPTHPNGWASDAFSVLVTRDEPTVAETFDLVPPMAAHAFTQAMLDSAMVVTDSGGVQEECNVLGIPCVVTRAVTDRPESVGDGGAVLPSELTPTGVFFACSKAERIDRATIRRDCFGNGGASASIVDWIQEILF